MAIFNTVLFLFCNALSSYSWQHKYVSDKQRRKLNFWSSSIDKDSIKDTSNRQRNVGKKENNGEVLWRGEQSHWNDAEKWLCVWLPGTVQRWDTIKDKTSNFLLFVTAGGRYRHEWKQWDSEISILISGWCASMPVCLCICVCVCVCVCLCTAVFVRTNFRSFEFYTMEVRTLFGKWGHFGFRVRVRIRFRLRLG